MTPTDLIISLGLGSDNLTDGLGSKVRGRCSGTGVYLNSSVVSPIVNIHEYSMESSS